MQENPFRQDKEELEELLRQYENLRNGTSHSFIEEDAFEKIIDYYDEKDDLNAALEAADHAIDQYPYSSGLQIKKADLLISLRKYNEALDLLSRAELLDSNDISLYVLKTEAFLAKGQHSKAYFLMDEALEKFEGEEKLELLFELADVYDDYEEFDRVFNCLKMVLETEPNNEEALYKICFWTDFTGRNEEGIRLHKKIIEEYPYNELAWFNLGAAYQGLKLYEKAIDAYQYAIAIDEKFDYAYRNMGDAFLRLRKYKDAIESLEKVLELARPEDVVYEAIGHCYDKLKKYPQARSNYRKASHLSPDDSHLYYKIACTYMNEMQWDAAIKNLESAMRIQRSQPEYNFALAKCYVQQNKIKEAVIYFSAYLKSRPRNINGWKELLKCLYTAGFYDEALEQVNNALKLTNNKTVLLFYKVAVCLALGRTKEALLILETAMEKSPKLIKELTDLNPTVLQMQQVVEIAARYRKHRK